jgi:L-ascorbate metabolism protein UlaG (beta-lactamase superfamily)
MDTETLKNDTGKTLFKSITKEKGGALHTSVAIVSKSGTVIIADPNSMPKDKGLIKADVITISHGHSDHNDIIFELPYLSGEVEGRVSQIKPESFTVKDVKVTGIAASHYSLFNKSLIPPSDVLYVYEVDGLRFAHLGDLGEDELTKEQLDQLGKLDIVFTAFDGAEAYGRSVDKCIKVLEQLKPTIVLPLHYAAEVVDKVLKKLNITDRSEMDTLAVDRKDLDNIKNPKYVFLK